MRIGVYRVLFGLACLSAVSAPLRGQDLISVDVNVAIADLSRKPIGINVNFLLDHDGNRPRALRTLIATPDTPLSSSGWFHTPISDPS